MTDKGIEAAARAINALNSSCAWEDHAEFWRRDCRAEATAAILAWIEANMDDPDKATIGAGFMAVDWLDTIDHIRDVGLVWRAMLSRLRDGLTQGGGG